MGRVFTVWLVIFGLGVNGLNAEQPILEIVDDGGEVYARWHASRGIQYRFDSSEDFGDWNHGENTYYGLGYTVQIPVYSYASEGGGTAGADALPSFTFLISPFSNGKTLVSWGPGNQVLLDSDGLPDNLPPVLSVSAGSEPDQYQLVIALFPIPWTDAYNYEPGLLVGNLTPEQQDHLALLTETHPVTLQQPSPSGGYLDHAPQNIPDHADLQEWFDQAFGKQANVFFDLTISEPIVTNWDLGSNWDPGDGQPNAGGLVKAADGLFVAGGNLASGHLEDRYVYDAADDAGTPKDAHVNVFIVRTPQPVSDGGVTTMRRYLIAPWPQFTKYEAVYGVAGPPEVRGFRNPIWILDVSPDEQPQGATPEFLYAHEIGHALGIFHPINAKGGLG